ncbi:MULTISPECIES: TetR/AcrR family transcriptional regulator [Clostridiaceae]|uniref:TetR/AcrR family transcriptional regulator n=1 Tax=Clostridiaceae TaxID=31979 RepID=UPI00055037BD|nr:MULTISPECIES: TetR/AcrR family transcriptional regulator [Clostridiaceae]
MAAPRKDNVKNLILDATEKLLETKKLSEISLAEIAKNAGISKGTLYYHYKSKNDILFDITDKYLKEQWNDLIAWTENPEKDTSLDRLVKYVLERDISSVGMRLHFFYDAMLGNEEIRIKLMQRYAEFAAIITEKIRERTDKIPAEYLTWLILLASDGLFIHKTLKNTSLDVDKFIAESSQFIKVLLPKN